MIYLETDRIRLREFNEEDVNLFLDLDSDPEVMTYLTDGRPSTPEEAEAGAKRALDLKEKYQNKFGLWIAHEKASGEFIGWFIFRPCKKNPDDLKTIEIGYRLKKKFWGMGFAPEVSRALLKKGFTELDVDTIFAITMEKNSKSRRVMEKIGLKFECNYIEAEFPGSDKNAVRYSLKRIHFLP